MFVSKISALLDSILESSADTDELVTVLFNTDEESENRQGNFIVRKLSRSLAKSFSCASPHCHSRLSSAATLDHRIIGRTVYYCIQVL
jgi:hypothetical protein